MENGEYVVCITGNDLHDCETAWRPVTATAQWAARTEATRLLGGGYLHQVLHVGWRTEDGRVQELAHRRIGDTVWTSELAECL